MTKARRSEIGVPRLAMNIDEVALSLGVSPNTVAAMVAEGRLPRPRVWHRRKLWRTAEIDAALSEWPIDGDDEEATLDEWRARA